MRKTWILTESDRPTNLLMQMQEVLSSIQNGASVNESWQEPGKLVIELWEVEPE
ncbi:hypothetical protein [Paenibacillus sp. FSL R7-0273]|uniref:hypothetical protein n=1 Tax=Paenibacillus sp. FSL R7-0273 TaxID=1536772 RepID=UPI000A9B0839|nr:hypothetical protein [Paenibacillus sp. FSL R7-0273]